MGSTGFPKVYLGIDHPWEQQQSSRIDRLPTIDAGSGRDLFYLAFVTGNVSGHSGAIWLKNVRISNNEVKHGRVRGILAPCAVAMPEIPASFRCVASRESRPGLCSRCTESRWGVPRVV